jgi:hypothetical protein
VRGWHGVVDLQAIMAAMEKVIVCTPLHRRASRATKMRTLLRYARPHGGNVAKRVKQVLPNANERSA